MGFYEVDQAIKLGKVLEVFADQHCDTEGHLQVLSRAAAHFGGVLVANDDENPDDLEDDDLVNPLGTAEVAHTPEPWEVCDLDDFRYPGIDGKGGSVIFYGTGNDEGGVRGETPEQCKANAQRIVNCVNYCNGIPNEELTTDKPTPIAEAYARMDRIEATLKASEEVLAAIRSASDPRYKEAWEWLHVNNCDLAYDDDSELWDVCGDEGPPFKNKADTPFGAVRQAMTQQAAPKFEKPAGRAKTDFDEAMDSLANFSPVDVGFKRPGFERERAGYLAGRDEAMKEVEATLETDVDFANDRIDRFRASQDATAEPEYDRTIRCTRGEQAMIEAYRATKGKA